MIGRVAETQHGHVPNGRLSEQLALQSFSGIRRLSLRYYDVNALSPNATQALMALLFGMIILYASHEYQANVLSKGQFVGFVTNLLMLMGPLKYLAELAAPLGMGAANISLLLDHVNALPRETAVRWRSAIGIRIDDVVYKIPYSTRSLYAQSVAIQAGDHVAVVGASGEGKSTLLDIMLGYRQVHAGRVALGTAGGSEPSPNAGAFDVMYLSQEEEPISATHLSALSIFAGLTSGGAGAREAIELCGLGHLLETMQPADEMSSIERICAQLTRSEQQRLLIAEAFHSTHSTYVIDEPLSALDADERMVLLGKLLHVKRGCTVIFTSHTVPSELELDLVVQIRNGDVMGYRP